MSLGLALWLAVGSARADVLFIEPECPHRDAVCTRDGAPGRCKRDGEKLVCVADPTDTDDVPDAVAPTGTEKRPERPTQQPPHGLLAGAAVDEPSPPPEPSSCACGSVAAPSWTAGLLLLLVARRR